MLPRLERPPDASRRNQGGRLHLQVWPGRVHLGLEEELRYEEPVFGSWTVPRLQGHSPAPLWPWDEAYACFAPHVSLCHRPSVTQFILSDCVHARPPCARSPSVRVRLLLHRLLSGTGLRGSPAGRNKPWCPPPRPSRWPAKLALSAQACSSSDCHGFLPQGRDENAMWLRANAMR